MIQKNKIKAIISSLIILIPIITGVVLWNVLPDRFSIHWGADGTVDGWSSKSFAVLVIPCIILALHWICLFMTAKDPKNKDQSNKAFGLVFWICPVISLFSSGIIYATAFGMELNVGVLLPAFIGICFALVGNYLPKCKQNYTIGIKIPWTLASEENWNKTHRFAGKIWVIGGLVLMASIFLHEDLTVIVIICSMLAIAVIPMVYSYILYKKQISRGDNISDRGAIDKKTASMKKGSMIFTAAVLIIVAVILLTGSISVKFEDTYFVIKTPYWSNLEVEYDAVESIEYRDECDVGIRTNGFGGPKLQLGYFRNDEFGTYSRYTYTGCEECIVMVAGGRTLVISGKDEGETIEIYNLLLEKIEK